MAVRERGFHRRGVPRCLSERLCEFDWPALEALLVDGGKKATGRPGHPAQTLFRALLLGVWYRLSDEVLAAQLARDLPFRRFCRLEPDRGTPDATTIGRFRAWLEAKGRLGPRFEAVKAQLAARHVILGEGRVAIVGVEPLPRHWFERQWRGVVEAARVPRRKLAEGESDSRTRRQGCP